MAQPSVPEGENGVAVAAPCLRFAHTATKSHFSGGSEIALSQNWPGSASHHTDQHVHCVSLSKNFSVALDIQ